MNHITIGKKLLVNALASHDESLVFFLSQLLKKLLQAVYHSHPFRMKLRVRRQNDVFPKIQGQASRKTLERLPTHDHGMAEGHIAESFLIRRNHYQKRIVFSDRPVFICCNNHIHMFSPL